VYLEAKHFCRHTLTRQQAKDAGIDCRSIQSFQNPGELGKKKGPLRNAPQESNSPLGEKRKGGGEREKASRRTSQGEQRDTTVGRGGQKNETPNNLRDLWGVKTKIGGRG